MTTHISPKPGFPEYGSSEPEIVLTCELTSLANVTAKTGAVQGSGAVDFNENGVLLSSTSGLRFTGLTAAQKAALFAGGTLTCFVENDWITQTNASDQWLIGAHKSGGTFTGIQKQANFARCDPYAENTSTVNRFAASIVGKPDFVRYDLTGIGKLATLYVDYLPVAKNAKWATEEATFDIIDLGANPASPSSPKGPIDNRVKAIMVSTKPVILPIHPKTARIAWFGHSYMAQCDYARINTGGGVGGLIGTMSYGEKTATRNYLTAPHVGDSHGCPTFHRELHKRGIGIGGGRIFNYAFGGKALYGTADGSSTEGGMAWQLAKATTPAEATFTATISGTTMTVSAVASGTLEVGMVLESNTPGTTLGVQTTITAMSPEATLGTFTGTGGVGTYQVSATQTVAGATSITGRRAAASTITAACMMWGANELGQLSGATTWDSAFGASGTISANWETTYATQIAAVVAAGCNLILIGNQPISPTVSNLTNIHDCNAAIDRVIAAANALYPGVCHKVDINALFGGDTLNTSYWGGVSGVDTAHPTLTMSGQIGMAFFNKFYEVM